MYALERAHFRARQAPEWLAHLRTWYVSPQFLTTTEVAELTRLNKNYLEKLRCTGGGPHFYRMNARRCVYALNDVLDWIAARRTANTSAPMPA